MTDKGTDSTCHIRSVIILYSVYNSIHRIWCGIAINPVFKYKRLSKKLLWLTHALLFDLNTSSWLEDGREEIN